MEQIKLTQVQTFSSASNAVSGSSKSLASMLACIDERLIVDEVLGVRQGHWKGVGHIVNAKGKASTSILTFSLVSLSQAEKQRHIDEKFEAQQHKIETLKGLIAQMTLA